MAEQQVRAPAYVYHIRVQGNLDAKWADWFPGFVMASRPGGETLLSGSGVDQAALYGALDRLQRLGLPLLLVVRTACPCPERDCPRHGQCAACGAFRDDVEQSSPCCFLNGNGWDEQCRQLLAAG